MSNTDKDIEILVLRHQLAVLQRRVDKPRLTPPDQAFLANLLHIIPRPTPRRLHLIVSPDTVPRWHRDLLHRRHSRASRPQQPGRRPTIRSIQALVLRLARDNPSWSYRRIHGELTTLGIEVAPSTVWDPQNQHPARAPPRPPHWATFLHNQDHTLLTAHFVETNTLTAAQLHVRPRHHRARHLPHPHPRRNRTPHRSLNHPDDQKSGHGPAGGQRHHEVPEPGP